MNVALDSLIDYILEVDLEYPQDLQNAHTDRFVRRAINRPTNGRTNSLSCCMIRSVMSYIIETCGNVHVTVFKFQKFTAYKNSHNLRGSANTLNSTQILERM